MKLFRRIFALTMVIAMVCLFSVSAFAYEYYVDYPFYDADNSRVIAFADISRYETYGTVEIEPTALIDQSIGINVEYAYSIGGVGLTDYDTAYEADSTTLTLTATIDNDPAYQMNSASYTYSVYFTTLSGDFNEFYAGPIPITYP